MNIIVVLGAAFSIAAIVLTALTILVLMLIGVLVFIFAFAGSVIAPIPVVRRNVVRGRHFS